MKYEYLTIKIKFLSSKNKEIKIKLVSDNEQFINSPDISIDKIINKTPLLKNYLNFEELFKITEIKKLKKKYNFIVVIDFNQLFFEFMKKLSIEKVILPYNKNITNLILNINNTKKEKYLKYKVVNKRLAEFKLSIDNLKTNILFDIKSKRLGILDINGKNTELLDFKFNLCNCAIFKIKNLKKFLLKKENFLIKGTIEKLIFENIKNFDLILKKEIKVSFIDIKDCEIKNFILNTKLLKQILRTQKNHAIIYLGVNITIENSNIENFFVNAFRKLEINKNTNIKNIVVEDCDAVLITNNNTGKIENANINTRYLIFYNTFISVVERFDNINVQNLLKFKYDINDLNKNYKELNLCVDDILHHLKNIYKYNFIINFTVSSSNDFYNNIYEGFYKYIFALVEKKLEKEEIVIKVYDYYIKHINYLKHVHIHIPKSIENSEIFEKLKKKTSYMICNII